MRTPIAVSAAVLGSYGALELKHDYRKHMLLAVLIAAALHLSIVGGILLFRASLPIPAEPEIRIVVIEGEATLDPPPPMFHQEPKFTYEKQLAELTAGIPVATPDEEVLENPHFPTTADLAILSSIAAQGTQFGDDVQVIVKAPVAQDWPDPAVFIPHQVEPVPIHFEMPVYPEMAALTGQSGTVWIQALVDTDGRVRQANVLTPSGTNVGFEEAAVKAAFDNLYKPAIQNGTPVAVWITYKVDFKLR